MNESVLIALRGGALSFARPLIAYLPLFIVTLSFRGNDAELAAASRFFVWFSLISAFASQGLGGYLYAINVTSGGSAGLQSLRLFASLRRGMCGWWTLLRFAAAFFSLILFVGLPVSPQNFLLSLVSVLLGPLLLVSSQYCISSGLLLGSLALSLIQSIVLLLAIVFIAAQYGFSPGGSAYVSLVLLVVLTVLSLRFIGQIRMNAIGRLWKLEPFTGSLRINRSARLKCFLDGFLPPVYTASVLTYFSWNETVGLSSDYQIAFYGYSRISDALISALVVFFTYSMADTRRSSVVEQSRKSLFRSPQSPISRPLSFYLSKILALLLISAATLTVGYVYNCNLIDLCLPSVIVFDFVLSMAKLLAIIGSFYFVTMTPRLSFWSQTVGLIACLSLMFSSLGVGFYMVAFASSFWLLQLILPVLYLFRRRLR